MSAALIIIGNEILSGRTQDKNLAWIAKELNECGVVLAEVRVIPDIEPVIIETVNHCRKNFAYVFTTGGIGPTHDDITSAGIAKAFGVALIRHPEAEALLRRHYAADQINAARLKMADVPDGARLIANPVSAAPGFVVENVYVMAGVPSIMQAMFHGIKGELKGGAKILSKTLSAYITEGTIAEALSAIQAQFPDVEIGSYPFIRAQKLGTSLVARSSDVQALESCGAALKALFQEHTDEVWEEE